MKVLATTGSITLVKKPLATLADDEILACCCTLNGTTQVSYYPKMKISCHYLLTVLNTYPN